MKPSALTRAKAFVIATAGAMLLVGTVGSTAAHASSTIVERHRTEVETTFHGLTGFFTDCPLPPQPGTCIGYSVNARNITEEAGDREYHDELVWVDGSVVTIDATGVHIGQRIYSSATSTDPPTFGGTPARVRIEGASVGRVRGKVTLHGVDGSTHQVSLNVVVTGGAAQPFAVDGPSFSVLCPAGATGHDAGVYSQPATTSGTMTIDGVALTPVPTIPGVAEAQVNSDRFKGTCNPTP